MTSTPTTTALAALLQQEYHSGVSDYLPQPSLEQAFTTVAHEFQDRDADELVDCRSEASTASSIQLNTQSEPDLSHNGQPKLKFKQSGRRVTSRATIEATYYQGEILQLLAGNEPNIELDREYRGDSAIDPEYFILRMTTDINEYLELILEGANYTSSREMMDVVREAFRIGGQSAGSRWIGSMPRFERTRVMSDLNLFIKYLTNDRLYLGFLQFRDNTDPTDDDFLDGDIVAPTEQNFDEDIPAADDDAGIFTRLGLTLTADDIGLTDDEKKTWFETADSNTRFPTRTIGKNKDYGTLPDHVPRAVTDSNPTGSWDIVRASKKNHLPEAIDVTAFSAEDQMVTKIDAFGSAIYAGRSYTYNPIIVIDAAPCTLYAEKTIDTVGVHADAVLSTVMRIEAFPHRGATMMLEYVFLCVSCQIDVPSAAVHQPVHDRTKDEVSEMLGRQISRALADAEGIRAPDYVPPPKDSPEFEAAKDIPIAERRNKYRELTRMHHAMAAIEPFVKTQGEESEDAEKVRDAIIMQLGKNMQREWSTDPDGNRSRERDGEWKQRITRICAKYLPILQLPILPMASAPLWLGQIVDYDGPLSRLGSIHIVVQLPRVPNWDHKNGVPPYLYIKEPGLPKKTTNGDKYAADLDAVKNSISCKAAIQMQIDELTLGERLKGCKKHEQMKRLEANRWLATLKGAPVTADLFKMIPLLENIRYQVLLSQTSGGNFDVDALFDDDDFTYDQPEYDNKGIVNPITTPQFQLNRNQALKAYTKMVLGFDRDQLQAFYDLDKLPYGMYFLQGCPGSGKSRVVSILACIIWDSELCAINDMQKHLSKSPHVESRAPTNVSIVEPEHDSTIVWDDPILDDVLPIATEETIEEDDKQTYECAHWDVAEPISFPCLRGGPAEDEIRTILQGTDPTLSPEDFLHKFLAQVQNRFLTQWHTDAAIWIKNTFMTAYQNRLSHLSRPVRASMFPELLRTNLARYMNYGERYFEKWASTVRTAITHASDEGYTTAAGYTAALSDMPDPVIFLNDNDTPEPEPIEDAWGAALQNLKQDNNDTKPMNKAPILPTDNRIAICVNRNAHAERVATGLLESYGQAHPDGSRLVIKVNNLALEAKQMIRDVRGLDRSTFMEDPTFSVSAQLNAELGLINGADYTLRQNGFERSLPGGVYTLGAMVHAIINNGGAQQLQTLLELEADGNAPNDPDRNKEIERLLMKLYRFILSTAHAVVATPVVMSKLADKNLYNPCLIIFDEAGMTPECDTMLIMNQFPGCRWFILVGDHVQGGIIALSNETGETSEPMLKLYQPPKDKHGNVHKVREADYRIKSELNVFKTPFVRQFKYSMLARLDKATPYVAHTNINHRSVGGLERIASVVAYEGKMESAYHPMDLSDAALKVQEFLHKQLDVIGKGSDNKRGSRATIFMEGTPTKTGTSWTNASQLQLAVYLAASAHMAGLKNDEGQLLTILILTPYAQAARDAKRLFAKLSDWEICRPQVTVATIDAAQGDEADLVITAYVVGDRGGFLFEKSRPVVGLTRAKMGAVDILNESICLKKNPNWQHWVTYYRMQKENNATTFTTRDWSNLSKITYIPNADRSVRAGDLYCGNCSSNGHHPRNCVKPLHGGLLADGSNIPVEYDTIGEKDTSHLNWKAPATGKSKSLKKAIKTDKLVKHYTEKFAALDVANVPNDITDLVQKLAPGSEEHQLPDQPDIHRDNDTDSADDAADEYNDMDDCLDYDVPQGKPKRRTKGKQPNFTKVYSSGPAIAWDTANLVGDDDDDDQDQQPSVEVSDDSGLSTDEDDDAAADEADDWTAAATSATADDAGAASDLPAVTTDWPGNTTTEEWTEGWGAAATAADNTWPKW